MSLSIMIQLLNYDQRKDHLEKDKELKKNRQTITKKHETKIFDILTEQDYTTTFQMKKRPSYYEEPYRHYDDPNFYFALKTIKLVLGKSTLRNTTVDKIISITNEIQALNEALNPHIPQARKELLLTPRNNKSQEEDEEKGYKDYSDWLRNH